MSLLSEILNRDMDLFYEYLDCDVKKSDSTSDFKLVADFTEYNPLHNRLKLFGCTILPLPLVWQDIL